MSASLESIVNKAKALIFDFDGTLVDSNAIKLKAFEKCFSDFQGKQKEILDYCLSHHHTPRFEKFRYVFENILKQSYTKKIEAKVLARYEFETTQRVIEAPPIAGANDFLHRWSAGRETALLSSTPHEILVKILEKRNMQNFFSLVQGAPVDKTSWLKGFCKGRRLKKEEVIFLGDTKEDAFAAKQADVTFVLIDGSFPQP